MTEKEKHVVAKQSAVYTIYRNMLNKPHIVHELIPFFGSTRGTKRNIDF